MPTYELKCSKCKRIYEIFMSVADYSKGRLCAHCHRRLDRYHGTPPNFSIPGSCTFDGVTKISNSHASKGQKEELAIPLNITNEDGSVTRVGKRSDIENE